MRALYHLAPPRLKLHYACHHIQLKRLSERGHCIKPDVVIGLGRKEGYYTNGVSNIVGHDPATNATIRMLVSRSLTQYASVCTKRIIRPYIVKNLMSDALNLISNLGGRTSHLVIITELVTFSIRQRDCDSCHIKPTNFAGRYGNESFDQ